MAKGQERLYVRGDKELIKKLRRMGDVRKFRRVIKKATNAASQELVKGVRRFWPVESGLSKRSVTKKISQRREGFSGIVGIDKNAEADDGTGQIHIPANIDHLIEFGFNHVGGSWVPPVAPLKRGFAASKAAAEAAFIRKAAAEIEKEAMRK